MHFKQFTAIITTALLLAGCGNAAENAGAEQTASMSETVSEQASEPVTESDGAVSQEIFAMDTYMVVKAYGDRAKDAVTAAVTEIQRLDALLSTGSEDSEVSVLNRAGGGSLSTDTETLIERSLQLYEDTDGAFDLSIYPVMELWGFTDDSFAVPDTVELHDTLALVDASKVTLNTEEHTVSYGTDGMKIDLGGIAKGYTSARVSEIFKSYGVESGLLNLGGNVQAIGAKTDGSSWNVAITNTDEDGYLGVLKIEDQAVITSGGYERYFEEDGVRYHHIIDPATGYPADNGVISSSIISSDGMLADGLSTSLYVMGLDDAIAYWQDHSEEFDFVLEDESGDLYITEGIAEAFSSDLNVTIVKKE
ncbi:MAG: FAD:protein FMN transferase [Lachnospiraceae bacterium]|nr:FAD:protein FMN transferase [Lachnospiraceae bacterium]